MPSFEMISSLGIQTLRNCPANLKITLISGIGEGTVFNK